MPDGEARTPRANAREAHAQGLPDMGRDVHCLAGLPFDAVDMAKAVERVCSAMLRRERCFVSTPNLNFLIGCRSDAAFRRSVIRSDLSIIDGMPLKWMAGVLGLPLRERVAGSDLFEALRRGDGQPILGRPVRIYFFGGAPGVAERAAAVLREEGRSMTCAGFHDPGDGDIAGMSRPAVLDAINASGADFLVVSLGARKGQAWITRNLDSLSVPVVSHLGAVVNFVAGSVARAPAWMQRTGLEWAWRIAEEPQLWRRYAGDAVGLAGLLATRILPLAIHRRRRPPAEDAGAASVTWRDTAGGGTLEVTGTVPDRLPGASRDAFGRAAGASGPVALELGGAQDLSPGFFGLLLLLQGHLEAQGRPLRVAGASAHLRRLFAWNGVAFLLDP